MKHSILNCPDCNKELTRVKRTSSDRLLNALTFNKHYNKRYYCFSCLKSFAYSNSQIADNDNAVTQPEVLKPQSFSVPKSVVAVAMFLVIAALTLAGNYIVNRNSSANIMSSTQNENFDSANR